MTVVVSELVLMKFKLLMAAAAGACLWMEN